MPPTQPNIPQVLSHQAPSSHPTSSSNSVISGLSSPPATPSTTGSSLPQAGARLNTNASAFVPSRGNKVTIKSMDGTEVDLGSYKTQQQQQPSSGGMAANVNRRSVSVRLESEEVRKKRLAHEEREVEEKAKKEREEKTRKEEEEQRKIREAEQEQERIRQEEERTRKEEERIRKEEEEEKERVRKEKEENERLLREESQRKKRAEEEEEKERLRKEEAERERLKIEDEKRIQKAEAEKEREREREEKEKEKEREREREREEKDNAAAAVAQVEAEETATTRTMDQANDSGANELMVAEIREMAKDEKPKDKEQLRIDTAVKTPPPHLDSQKKRPDPLNLSKAHKSNVVAPLPSALATARNIEDLGRVPYPEGVSSPKVELNINAKDGKFR